MGENWTGGANRDLTSNKVLKKSTRGTFDFRCDGTVFMCKRNDDLVNSVITVASNCQTHSPVHEVRRRVKGQPVNNVQQPHLIHAYNQGMGGVDLMVRMLASYRPSIRGEKWDWPLFTNALNGDCSGGMMDPLQDVSDVTSRLPTGDCNLFAEDVHGQPFASWRWTAGQPAWWCQVWWRRPWESGGFPRQMQDLQKHCRYMCAKCNVRSRYDRGSKCRVTYQMRSGQSQ